MKTIKFLSRQVYETEGPGKGPVFEEGASYKLDDDKADRWIRRGKAVEVTGRAASRAGSAPVGDGLDLLDDGALIDKAKELGIDDGAARDDLIAKIRAKLAAPQA